MSTPGELEQYLKSVADATGGLPVWTFIEIGRGGSHIVYRRHPADPFVIKIPHAYCQLPTHQGTPSQEDRVRIEQEVAYLTTGYERLTQYFGREWCIPQQARVITIRLAPGAEPFPTYAIVQPYEPAFRHPLVVRIDTPYIELQLDDQRVDRQLYRRLNAALLGTADPDVEPYTHLNPAVQPCLAHIDSDPRFRDLIQQFLAKFEVYREQTDEIIDMVGEYNVFAVPEAERWSLHIGSVLKGQSHADFLAALAQLRQVGGQGQRLSTYHRFILLNGLAVYRLINALAIQTGLGRLIDLRLDHEQLEAISTVRFAYE